MVLSDATIAELCTHKHLPMIEPFFNESIKLSESGEGIASYGVSSYGYDIRAAPEFKVFKNTSQNGVLDYKNMDESLFENVNADQVIIPPNGFILARSVEYIRVPTDVLVLVIGKSTIARAGINCLCTPLEPGWEGHITLEFANGTSLPNRFYANEGVLQLVFLKGDRECLVNYATRLGKYQAQRGEIVLPKV